MKARCHPIFDNPLRMGYVAGWSSIAELIQRLGDLEQAVGENRVVPATWEPFYRERPVGWRLRVGPMPTAESGCFRPGTGAFPGRTRTAFHPDRPRVLVDPFHQK